ncbi:HpcH/HpaI aldolase/citrate lyase family protein [Xenorhabdus sp. KK7.4]|uniref:HpcH/HpaI aldolase/citrate lyase family protein n=1 Tax=Xenorhabdus sp. KK7.4 TaxID=1851572 RepID=UPI000C05E972|nr:aldolase/citrate lyase family protein [Xenorhabdus sp. KK7.4]PHM51214.1 citrate lyase beta chain [Xenorhabdus sp. KK7.4]
MLRSWLCSSALNGKLVEKSENYNADVIHFDLEDSVPLTQKEDARNSLLKHYPFDHRLPVAIRINSLDTEEGLKDILFLTERSLQPDIVIVPKSSIARDVPLISTYFKNSLIFSVIETIDNFFELRHLNHRPKALDGVIFGAADFAVDMDLNPQTLTNELSYIKAEISICAKRLGLHAIDSPCFSVYEHDMLQLEIEKAKKLGYTGKIALHPNQVSTINKGFAICEDSKAKAQSIVSMLESNKQRSVAMDSEEMVGPPHLKYSKKILSGRIR